MGRRARGYRLRLRDVAAGGAASAQMWGKDERMSLWAHVSGRVAERVLTDGRRLYSRRSRRAATGRIRTLGWARPGWDRRPGPG
jgi:hypothetical protein